jgi:hypothetical protein
MDIFNQLDAIKLQNTKNPNCTMCQFFASFADDYCDNMEPCDQGFCRNNNSEYYGNNGAGFDICCEYFKALSESR